MDWPQIFDKKVVTKLWNREKENNYDTQTFSSQKFLVTKSCIYTTSTKKFFFQLFQSYPDEKNQLLVSCLWLNLVSQKKWRNFFFSQNFLLILLTLSKFAFVHLEQITNKKNQHIFLPRQKMKSSQTKNSVWFQSQIFIFTFGWKCQVVEDS